MVVFYYMHVHCQDDLNSMNRARGVGTTTMNHDHKMMIIYYTTCILIRVHVLLFCTNLVYNKNTIHILFTVYMFRQFYCVLVFTEISTTRVQSANELKISLRIDCDVKGKKALYLIITWIIRKNVFIDKCCKIVDEGSCV